MESAILDCELQGALAEGGQPARQDLEALRRLALPGTNAVLAGEGEVQGEAEWLTGASRCALGVAPQRLLSGRELDGAARAAALAAVLPLIERRLAERCSLVAQAANYDGQEDYSALPEHIQRLQAAAQRGALLTSWQDAVGAAEAAQRGLAEAAAKLLAVLRHKLSHQAECDAAQGAAAAAQCSTLLGKLRGVAAQLSAATYTPATVPALQRLSQHVEAGLAGTAAQLQQALLLRGQYAALGPAFEELAAAHGAAVRRGEEAEFEVREVEQFQRLAGVLGQGLRQGAARGTNL